MENPAPVMLMEQADLRSLIYSWNNKHLEDATLLL